MHGYALVAQALDDQGQVGRAVGALLDEDGVVGVQKLAHAAVELPARRSRDAVGRVDGGLAGKLVGVGGVGVHGVEDDATGFA